VRTWRWYSKLFLALAIAALMVLLICVPLSRVLVPALVGLWLTVAAMAGAGGTDADGPPSLVKFICALGFFVGLLLLFLADRWLCRHFGWHQGTVTSALVWASVGLVVGSLWGFTRGRRLEESERLRMERQGHYQETAP